MSARIESLQIGMHWFAERPGGLDRVFMALIESLPSVGVDVRGLVLGSERVVENTGGVVETFAREGDRLGTRLIGARRHAARLKLARKPDVVATHFALYTAPLVDLFARVPRVVHFQGPWAAEATMPGRDRLSYAIRHAIERYAYRGAGRYIVLSHAFGRVLREDYHVPESLIRVVPGCMDAARFDIALTKRAAREALGLSMDRPQLFCIRRLVGRMGLEDLIDAMFVVKQSVPDVHLTIAGKGPLEAALRARIEARGLTEHVTLAGFVPDEQLPVWYRSADLSIVPTIKLEGFGLTTIESLATGTPVLVTPVGGLPEAVAPLSEALVLPSVGFHAIADGIVEALLGRLPLPDEHACRSYARSHFDRPVMAANVAAVYRELLDRTHA
jgi:glycosyltransferase involved in cell wall biosynthesis